MVLFPLLLLLPYAGSFNLISNGNRLHSRASDFSQLYGNQFNGESAINLLTSSALLSEAFGNQATQGKSCPCPGCAYADDPLGVPIIASAKRFFTKNDNMWVNGKEPSYPIHFPTPDPGWRTLAKLAASPLSRFKPGCTFGLYTPGTHTVLPVLDCPAHHPMINEFLEILQKATKKAGVTACVETPKVSH